ncbi:hypothetical protein [Marinicella litoralis]|uniref:Uncharacterized protein n=1 Tax=Marinicella litoralis TaxID=644220 RepID=A0A4R6XWE0_9GAMM|nr:hypothetical protein [Marinicella litoralis]TDR20808.1 hypothetical protein C8D91_1786 [Marinicella litoralis]
MKLNLYIMIGILMLTGCKDSIEDIDTKSVKRWEAIIASDYDEAYSYFTPGYKKTETVESFANKLTNAKLRVEWKAVKFVEKSCESEEICDVKLELTYKYKFPRKAMGEIELPSVITEKWMLKDGKWSFLPKLDYGV